MNDPCGRVPECAGRFLVTHAKIREPVDLADPCTEFHFQLSRQAVQDRTHPVNRVYSLFVGDRLLLVRDDHNDAVAHDRPDDAPLEGLDDRPDLLIPLLRPDPCLHRAGKVSVLLFESEADHLAVGVGLMHFQKLAVVFHIVYVVRQEHAGDKSILHYRNDRLQLLLDLQLVRPLSPDPVHLLHCVTDRFEDHLPGNGFHEVFLDPERDGVLRIVELVVRGDHIEQAGGIE